MERFVSLPDWQQSMLLGSLELLAELMDAPTQKTAPMLAGGELTRNER